MTTLYLVACSSKKLRSCLPASCLYVSPLFRKSRSYVETQGHPWFILSAKHHLIHPEKPLDWYDQRLSNKKAELCEWSNDVLKQLTCHLEGVTTVVFFAGKLYRERLAEKLTEKGIKVCVPMKGMRIGEQLRWLNERLAD